MAPQDLVFFAVVLLVGYLLIVRPQRARARQLREVREALTPGCRVMTTAGLYGTITAVGEATVELEVADDVRVTFASAAILRVLDPVDAPTDVASEGSTNP